MRLLAVFWLFGLCCTSSFSQGNKKHKEQLIEQYYTRGIAVRPLQKDSSYHYFDLAYKFSVELNNYSDALHILNESIKTSGRHSDLKKYAFYLGRIESIIQNDSIKNGLVDREYFEDRFVYEKGKYLFNLSDLSSAKPLFRKLFNTYRIRDISSLVSYELSNLVHSVNYLASIYLHSGKYDLAENYLNRSLAFLRKSNTKITKALENATNRQLTDFYIQTGNYSKAREMLDNLLKVNKRLYDKDKNFKGNLVSVYHRIVENSLRQDSVNKALLFLDESQEYLLGEDSFRKKSLLLYGDIHLKLNQEEKALASYQIALKEFQEYRQGKPHQDIAEVYGKIAKFHLNQERYQEGLETIQKAFNNSGDDIALNKEDKNPVAAEVYSKRQLLQLLDTKLKLLQIAHFKTDDDEYLDAAIQTNKAILGTFNLLKKEFESKLDKQFLAETAYPIFHRMLAITYEAYRKNSTTDLFELALNISEKNKDFLLLEALRNANATQYGDVPEEIIEKEAQLRTEISNLEKTLFDTTEEESNFSEELFELKQEYFGFLDTLENKYPKYHDLKYQSQNLNIATIGNLLENNEVLISFTMTEENLFALVLDDDSQDFVKLPFDESDRESARDFYRLLSSPTIIDNSALISESGKLLFEKILKLPLSNFESENLTIIPDDVLHYLPFDLLMKENELLLHSKFISYGNSISSYLELKEKEKATAEKLLAFAPSFDDQIVESEIRFEFGKLLYNDDEVEKISSAFETEVYIDTNATLENFKKRASDFNVIHLATHASANDEYPDYSYLAFSKSEGGKQHPLY